MPAKSHDADSLGFEPSGSRAHDPAANQHGDRDAERSARRPALTEGNRAFSAGRHAADDGVPAETSREADQKEISVTAEMIVAGADEYRSRYLSVRDCEEGAVEAMVKAVFLGMLRASGRSP